MTFIAGLLFLLIFVIFGQAVTIFIRDYRETLQDVSLYTELTIIPIGPKPGLYHNGKYVRAYNDEPMEVLRAKYKLRNFWHSPEAHVYNIKWWRAYGLDFNEVLTYVPPDLQPGYLNAIQA